LDGPLAGKAVGRQEVGAERCTERYQRQSCAAGHHKVHVLCRQTEHYGPRPYDWPRQPSALLSPRHTCLRSLQTCNSCTRPKLTSSHDTKCHRSVVRFRLVTYLSDSSAKVSTSLTLLFESCSMDAPNNVLQLQGGLHFEKHTMIFQQAELSMAVKLAHIPPAGEFCRLQYVGSSL
jgi:hypothetical protein